MDGCLRGPLARALSKFRRNPWADWPQKTFCFVFGLFKNEGLPQGMSCLLRDSAPLAGGGLVHKPSYQILYTVADQHGLFTQNWIGRYFRAK